MTSRASLFLVGLVAAASLPTLASAGPLGAAHVAGTASESVIERVANTPTAAQQKALAAQKKKQQQAAAARQRAAAAKAKQEKEEDEWYAKDRERGLDIASEYAPNAIKKVRQNNYVAKGDTVNTGNGKKGWRQYMDKYYSR